MYTITICLNKNNNNNQIVRLRKGMDKTKVLDNHPYVRKGKGII